MTETSQTPSGGGIRLRQLTHYQFRWVAGQEASAPGMWTLQLILDQGAAEEVLTVNADDADVLQDMLATAHKVHYDTEQRGLSFGTIAVGS